MLHLQKVDLYCSVMIKKVTTKRQRKSLAKMAVYLLLVLYFAGTSQFELLHSFVHKHQSHVTHTVGQEMDPCHRLIYHNDVENGCHYDAHLVTSDECQMCDIAFHGDQTILKDIPFAAKVFQSKHFNSYKYHLDSYWAVISSSRAPPNAAEVL